MMILKRRELNGSETCRRKKRENITLIVNMKEIELGRSKLEWDNTKTDIK
jgi:hypothetical protein